MANLQFDNGSSAGRQAIVASFDLCGFSDFCNHPEAYAILPRFISAVFDELDSVLMGTLEEFWEGIDPNKPQAPAPDFIKYTGDGALMIWFPPENAEARQKYGTVITSAMRKFQRRLVEIIPKWEIEWPADQLPHRARFGIAAGRVYPLKLKSLIPDVDDPVDYAGYCINLAVRLQDHCPEIGFIVHELVFPKLEGLVKWIAHGMKGTSSVPVLVFADTDVPGIPIDRFKSKFLPSGEESQIRCDATGRQSQTIPGSESSPSAGQPRYEAYFYSGEKFNLVAFLDSPFKTIGLIMDEKDSTGKIIGKKKLLYRLDLTGSPLIYQFDRSVPFVGHDVNSAQCELHLSDDMIASGRRPNIPIPRRRD